LRKVTARDLGIRTQDDAEWYAFAMDSIEIAVSAGKWAECV
jgi:hypothetical protein